MFVTLLILIFLRPFISSLAFAYVNLIHSFLLLGSLVVWVAIRKEDLKEIGFIKYTLMLFTTVLFISLISSQNIIISIKELYKYITGILLLLFGASLTQKEGNRIVFCIVIAGLLISFLAIYQYLFGFKHLLYYISNQGITNQFALDYISRKRAFLPFVTPNTLAGYLIMIIPLALMQKHKTWFLMPLFLALFLTQSLGGLLSIFFALTIYFYLQGKFEKRKVILLFTLLLIIGLVFSTRTISQQQHAQPIFSTTMRLNYWGEAIKVIETNPWVGIGLGNFNTSLSRYAHNSYLQIWAEMGIFGIISFLWFLYVILKPIFRYARNAISQEHIAGLTAAYIVFLFHNLFDFTFFLPEVNFIWWIVSGIIISKKWTL